MYQALAACALGMIADSSRYAPCIDVHGDYVYYIWGLNSKGDHVFTQLYAAHQLSFIGAMRAAEELFNSDTRVYSALYKHVVRVIAIYYPMADVLLLTHEQACHVLKIVAKG